MNTRREFNAMSINVTTRMTQLCWERLRKIVSRFQLESLTIACGDPRNEAHVHLVEILVKLPANTLKELSLMNVNVDHIQQFLTRQSSLKKLSVTGAVGDPDFISRLELSHLKLIGPKSKVLADIIERQPRLTSLKLTTDDESEYNDAVFAEIVKLGQLETLDIPFNANLSPRTIANLGRLRKLKKLSVSCSQLGFLYLTLTSIPSLKELDVTLDEPVPNDAIKSLAGNIPNLTIIKFRGPLVANFLSDFVSRYPHLHSLWIENKESYFVNVVNFQAAAALHVKLKHLFVVNHDRKVVICANDLIRFIKMFPQLDTLVVTKFIPIQLNNVQVILKHLPGLREIIIDSKNFDSTTKIMSTISEEGRSLKFVMLENFKLQSNADSLKVFFDGKFPVVEKKDGNLILRSMESSFLSRNIDIK